MFILAQFIIASMFWYLEFRRPVRLAALILSSDYFNAIYFGADHLGPGLFDADSFDVCLFDVGSFGYLDGSLHNGLRDLLH